MPVRSKPRNLVCRQLRRSKSPAPDIALGRFDRRRAAAGSAQGAGKSRFRYRTVYLQFVHPGANTDVAGVPNCRAINDKVLAIAREIRPEIVLLHSTWDRYLDGVAETVTALKQQTHARIIVLGSVPWWKRGLPNEVLRYFMLHHRLIPERSDRAAPDSSAMRLREKLVPLGAKFISVWDTMCNAHGCLARIGDTAKDISASDPVHLTEKGSVFLGQSVIHEVLRAQAPPSSAESQ